MQDVWIIIRGGPTCVKTKATPKSKHLSLIERQQIERRLNERVSVTEIVNRLGRNKSSISRETKRDKVEHKNSDWTKSYVYRWDVAQRNYEKNKGGGGRYPRLHSAHPLLQSLQRLRTKKRLSPYAAMCVLQKQGHELDLCVKTLYNHIGRENFPIKREHLPHGCYRRRKSGNLTPCRKHMNLKGESIDNRPESINARKEAGHHEMDLVVGARGGKKALHHRESLPLSEYRTHQR